MIIIIMITTIIIITVITKNQNHFHQVPAAPRFARRRGGSTDTPNGARTQPWQSSLSSYHIISYHVMSCHVIIIIIIFIIIITIIIITIIFIHSHVHRQPKIETTQWRWGTFRTSSKLSFLFLSCCSRRKESPRRRVLADHWRDCKYMGVSSPMTLDI